MIKILLVEDDLGLSNSVFDFLDDFADVMEQIETEYKAANQLTDVSDSEGGVTTSADTLLVRNWQDILAIYVYEKNPA